MNGNTGDNSIYIYQLNKLTLMIYTNFCLYLKSHIYYFVGKTTLEQNVLVLLCLLMNIVDMFKIIYNQS